MLAVVSRPPVNTPSASPPRSKSLISSPCSRMIWPIRPGPGRLPLPPGRLHQEAPRLRDRADRARAALGHVEPRGREAPEALPVLARQPEQVADHPERHRERERLHEVDDGAVPLHRVEPLLDDGRDQRAEPLQPVHGELGGEQPAQPGVVGRVGEPEAADVAAGGGAARAHQRPDVVAEALGVREHRARLRVAGDDPDRHAEEGREPVHRLRGAGRADARRPGRRRRGPAAR